MKIAAEIRFKQGDLFEAMQTLGWSGMKFSEESGIPYNSMLAILALRRKPTSPQVLAMQETLDRNGIFVDLANLWPEQFGVLRKSPRMIQYGQIDDRLLSSLNTEHSVKMIEDRGDQQRKEFDFKNLTEEMLGSLTEREAGFVRSYWVDGKSYDEIGRQDGCTAGNVQRLTMKSLRKLRHRFKDLDPFDA